MHHGIYLHLVSHMNLYITGSFLRSGDVPIELLTIFTSVDSYEHLIEALIKRLVAVTTTY